MARIAFVADCHVGNPKKHGGPVVAGINTRGQIVLDTLARAVRRAREKEADLLAVLGDLFDTDTPTPQLIAAVQRIFAAMPVVAIVGNHDQRSTALGDHAIAPLAPVKTFVFFERAEVLRVEDAEVAFVPFQPDPAHSWFPAAVRALAPPKRGVKRALCFHLGIEDKDTAPWLKGAADSVPLAVLREILEEQGCAAAFAGNWHDRRLWDGERPVLQVGTLCPTGWNNSGMDGYGTLALWDSKTGRIEIEEIPGPRFITADDPEDARKIFKPEKRRREDGWRCFPKFTVDGLEVSAARQQAQQAKEAEGWIEEFEVGLDEVELKIAAKKAASAARSAQTLEQAIVDYVAKRPMAPQIDRARVCARVLELLGG